MFISFCLIQFVSGLQVDLSNVFSAFFCAFTFGRRLQVCSWGMLAKSRCLHRLNTNWPIGALQLLLSFKFILSIQINEMLMLWKNFLAFSILHVLHFKFQVVSYYAGKIFKLIRLFIDMCLQLQINIFFREGLAASQFHNLGQAGAHRSHHGLSLPSSSTWPTSLRSSLLLCIWELLRQHFVVHSFNIFFTIQFMIFYCFTCVKSTEPVTDVLTENSVGSRTPTQEFQIVVCISILLS